MKINRTASHRVFARVERVRRDVVLGRKEERAREAGREAWQDVFGRCRLGCWCRLGRHGGGDRVLERRGRYALGIDARTAERRRTGNLARRC
jgi:hypothetical protein